MIDVLRGRVVGYGNAVQIRLDLAVAGSPVLFLDGDIDLVASDELRQAGDSALASSADGGSVTLDFHRVRMLDSSGLGALISLRDSAAEKGVELVLRALPPRVMRVLEITALESAFTVEP